MSEGLCPKIGQEFTVQGKVSSPLFKDFKVTISRCNSTSDPTCASDAMFAAVEASVKQFTLVTPIINSNVNPGN